MGRVMARHPLLCPAVAAVACLMSTSAAAQTLAPTPPTPVRQIAAGPTQGDLRGTVLDEQGKPLAGAVVSAVGTVIGRAPRSLGRSRTTVHNDDTPENLPTAVSGDDTPYPAGWS